MSDRKIAVIRDTAPDEGGATSGPALRSRDPAARLHVPWVSWYALAILAAMNFFAYVDRSALALLLEPIKAELHLKDRDLGLLSGLAFAALYATVGIPLARVADRSSRVKLVAASLAFWSVMTAVCGLARNFPQLFLARMGVGVGEAGCVTAAHSLISDYFPRERRALAISIFQAGAVVGLSVGLFIVGAIGQTLGWRAALQIVGLAGAPLALLSWLTLREPMRPQAQTPTNEPALQAIGALMRRPAFVHLAVAYALSTICTSSMTQWMPSLLMRSFGMSMAQVGAWSGMASAVGGVLGLLTGGFLATWLAPRDPRWELRLPAITYALYIPLYILMILSPTAVSALLLKTVANFVAAIGGGLAVASVQSFAEPNRRATAVSLVLFLSSMLGMGLGPYLIGALSDILAPSLGRESLRYAMLISCAIVVWSVAHFHLAAKHSTKDRVN
jgi:MFS family permease